MNKVTTQTIFIALGLITFLSGFNSTSIATIMPHIDFIFNSELYTFVFNSFILTSMIGLILSGVLIDLYGIRRILLIGLIIFAFSSYLCSISLSIYDIILYRTLQGLGAGILTTSAISYIAILFPPNIRSKKQSILAMIYGVSSLLAPVISIYLVNNYNWSIIFLINIPLTIISFIIVYFIVKETKITNVIKKHLIILVFYTF